MPLVAHCLAAWPAPKFSTQACHAYVCCLGGASASWGHATCGRTTPVAHSRRLPCAPTILRSPQDATFEFERRRNRPERYDRNVMGATLKVRARRRCRGEGPSLWTQVPDTCCASSSREQAMKRVGEIREKRAERFWEERMKGKASRELADARKELDRDIHLVQAPDSLLVDKSRRRQAVVDTEADAEEERLEDVAMGEEPAQEIVRAPKAAKRAAAKAKTPKFKVPASDRMRE